MINDPQNKIPATQAGFAICSPKIFPFVPIETQYAGKATRYYLWFNATQNYYTKNPSEMLLRLSCQILINCKL